MTDIKTVPTKEACALAGVSRQTLYNRTKPIVAGHGRTPSQWSIADLERIKARMGGGKMSNRLPTDQEIEREIAKLKKTNAFRFVGGHWSESHDSVRISAAWLSAQKRIKNPKSCWYMPLKHVIECWGGRYVSTSDVIVAASLLGLKGNYPEFNISKRLTRPAVERLAPIKEAGIHRSTYTRFNHVYSRAEQGGES